MGSGGGSASGAGASNCRSSGLGQDSVQTAEGDVLVSPNVSSVTSSAGMVCPTSGDDRVDSVSEGEVDSGRSAGGRKNRRSWS